MATETKGILSPARLAEIAARCKAASEGPWDALLQCGVELIHNNQTIAALPDEDKMFLAHARQDIPEMHAHITAQAERLTMLEAVLSDAVEEHSPEWIERIRADERARCVTILERLKKHYAWHQYSGKSLCEIAIEQMRNLGPVQPLPMSVLRSENARLRAALREINATYDDPTATISVCGDIARKALEEDTTP